jgi:LL-diaminopimelate aminotransferase
MARVNDNYLKLKSSYLFTDIAARIKAFQAQHPDARIIRLGIGDVTQPLPPAVIAALHTAVDEMTRSETFRGYGPEPGYEFLTELIAEHDYGSRGVRMAPDEIFVSDGGKSDSANIQEIFGPDTVVAVTDPIYPVYVDSNVMAGRSGPAGESGRYEGFVYLPCTAETAFLPALPDRHVDLIYLCYPNNPTGAVMTRETLKRWVDYARREEAVLLYDAAYVGYIREAHVPHSIFEIEGAREVAIEFRSFSKLAGFTGTRCAFTVVPKELQGRAANGDRVSLNALWLRRQSTKFNGVPYIVQRGAAAVYTDEGRQQVQGLIDFYMDNARIIREGLEAIGLTVHGGRNAP